MLKAKILKFPQIKCRNRKRNRNNNNNNNNNNEKRNIIKDAQFSQIGASNNFK